MPGDSLVGPSETSSGEALGVQRMFRGAGWPAAATGLILTAGAFAGASGVVADAAPTGPQAVHVQLAYGCRFPSGLRQAGVTVSGTFPATAVVGQPIQPTGLRVAVGLPHPAVSDLTGLGAATVTGSDLLTASVTHSANAATARWPGQLPRSVPLPATGSLQLTASGPVPPLTVSSPGTVTLTASGLSLALTPRKAGGAPTSPATLRVACTLSPGQNAKLAAIPVTSASPSPAASGTPPTRAPSPAAPAGRGKIPKGCGAIRIKSPQIACAYITGYANVTKLNGAALLQPSKPQKPGLVNIAENVSIKNVKGGVILNNIGQLYHRGHEELPPVQTTFLGFGFVPITATLEVTELKPIKITVFLHKVVLVKVTASTEVSFRLSNATVNGVPWKNLGSHCQTKTPVKLNLIGSGNTSTQRGFWNLQKGGTLGGMVTIPPFTACGVGENLDPLFTASISGPRNFDLMTQGSLCFIRPFFPDTCPPLVPKPERHLITG